MSFADIVATALGQIRANKLRSFFTTLGIIVSVTFLVAVIAIIQGMNAYVTENISNALIGRDAFQVRRTPRQVGLFNDEEMRRVGRRPRITESDAAAVAAALPDAEAVSRQSGWPTPISDVIWRNRKIGDVTIFGVTAPYQIVHDYSFSSGRPLSDLDVRDKRRVTVIGADVAEKLFESVNAVGQEIRVQNERFEVVGVVAKKGRVLGESFDGFVLLPLPVFETIYGRRLTTTISVKMPTSELVRPGMRRAEAAMRVAHRLRPSDENDFNVETTDALVSFWQNLTRVLFAVVPALVTIGVVVGGIVIMNIMLVAVNERTREIGIRKSSGARARDIRRQFLAEAVMLSTLGGAGGILAGWMLAATISALSPLPARVTLWSIIVALSLGAGVGVIFGVYPAARAAKLDPIAALRAE